MFAFQDKDRILAEIARLNDEQQTAWLAFDAAKSTLEEDMTSALDIFEDHLKGYQDLQEKLEWKDFIHVAAEAYPSVHNARSEVAGKVDPFPDKWF